MSIQFTVPGFKLMTFGTWFSPHYYTRAHALIQLIVSFAILEKTTILNTIVVIGNRDFQNGKIWKRKDFLPDIF